MQQAFVQRRTTLTQEQWDKFLSRDAHASNASLNTLFSSVGHGHGVNKGADSPYMVHSMGHLLGSAGVSF